MIPPSTNFSFHYGKTYNHMLWKSVKCDCCVFECCDRPYPGIVSTSKNISGLLVSERPHLQNKIYFMEYIINYLRDAHVAAAFVVANVCDNVRL